MEKQYYEHTCACGCGGKIEIKKTHKWNGIPKYISGHNTPIKNKFEEWKSKQKPVKCACGCGNYIEFKNHQRWTGVPKYIFNHEPRPKGKNSASWKGGKNSKRAKQKRKESNKKRIERMKENGTYEDYRRKRNKRQYQLNKNKENYKNRVSAARKKYYLENKEKIHNMKSARRFYLSFNIDIGTFDKEHKETLIEFHRNIVASKNKIAEVRKYKHITKIN